MAARPSHGDGGSAGGGVGGPTSKSISHTLLSYNAVLKACVRAGEPDVAVRLLQVEAIGHPFASKTRLRKGSHWEGK
jgi:pentatricopeptide repeat protein